MIGADEAKAAKQGYQGWIRRWRGVSEVVEGPREAESSGQYRRDVSCSSCTCLRRRPVAVVGRRDGASAARERSLSLVLGHRPFADSTGCRVVSAFQTAY